MLYELLVRLPAHRLIKREHKVVVELFFCIFIEHVVALKESLLRAKVVFAAVKAALSCCGG
jgi:hypothetical protein